MCFARQKERDIPEAAAPVTEKWFWSCEVVLLLLVLSYLCLGVVLNKEAVRPVGVLPPAPTRHNTFLFGSNGEGKGVGRWGGRGAVVIKQRRHISHSGGEQLEEWLHLLVSWPTQTLLTVTVRLAAVCYINLN